MTEVTKRPAPIAGEPKISRPSNDLNPCLPPRHAHEGRPHYRQVTTFGITRNLVRRAYCDHCGNVFNLVEPIR